MNNFEKIKKMSIDEMVHKMKCPSNYDVEFFCENQNITNCLRRDCKECRKKWLEQEVEE